MPRAHQILCVALAACFGVWWFSDRIDPYLLDVITSIGINIILAVSLNLVNGYTGQFSLGHAGFMAIGAYLSGACTIFLGPQWLGPDGGNPWSQGMLFLGALLVGGLSASVAGLLIGIPSLRLKGDYLALVTLGFGEIIRVIFQNTEALGGALGLSPIPAYTNILWTYGFVTLTVFVVVTLTRSTYGRGFLATRDDEIAAEAVGLDTTRYKIVAFVVGHSRGHRRWTLRTLQAVDLSDGIRFHEVDRDRRHGHPGGHGQHAGGHPCRHSAHSAAGSAAAGRRIPDGALLLSPDRAHAGAPAGVVQLPAARRKTRVLMLAAPHLRLPRRPRAIRCRCCSSTG